MNSEHTDLHSPENQDDTRVSLPQPDAENITVLTKALPNEPILPWHHFDSPWLNLQESAAAEKVAVQPDGLYDPDANPEIAQLSLFEQSPEPLPQPSADTSDVDPPRPSNGQLPDGASPEERLQDAAAAVTAPESAPPAAAAAAVPADLPEP